MSVHVVTNTRGYRRYTEALTGRCTICDLPTATECACGRCLDMEPWPSDGVIAELLFDEHSEITRMRDGEREDAEAERRRSDGSW